MTLAWWHMKQNMVSSYAENFTLHKNITQESHLFTFKSGCVYIVCPVRKHIPFWILYTCFGAKENDNAYTGEAKTRQMSAAYSVFPKLNTSRPAITKKICCVSQHSTRVWRINQEVGCYMKRWTVSTQQRRTRRALPESCKMTSSRLLMYTCLAKQNPGGPCEGWMPFSGTCAQRPVPSSLTGICQRKNRTGRSATFALFSWQMKLQAS